jgi:1-deoxy-D-xylulose-5-phosphate reductoisomerase
VFNAVNEVAVALFLEGRIGFPDIPALCARVLDAHEPRAVDSLATLMEVDRWARAEARAVQPASPFRYR